MLAGAADASPEALAALAALIPEGGVLGTAERDEMPAPPGTRAAKRAMLAQMVLGRLEGDARPPTSCRSAMPMRPRCSRWRP